MCSWRAPKFFAAKSDFQAMDNAIEQGASALQSVKNCVERMSESGDKLDFAQNTGGNTKPLAVEQAKLIVHEFETLALASETDQDKEILASLQRFGAPSDATAMSGT